MTGKTIRIALLRVLISWYFIPGAWLLCWPFIALVFGHKAATKEIKYFTFVMWFGGEYCQ